MRKTKKIYEPKQPYERTYSECSEITKDHIDEAINKLNKASELPNAKNSYDLHLLRDIIEDILNTLRFANRLLEAKLSYEEMEKWNAYKTRK